MGVVREKLEEEEESGAEIVAEAVAGAMPCLALFMLLVIPCAIFSYGFETAKTLQGVIVSKSWKKGINLQENRGKDHHGKILWETVKTHSITNEDDKTLPSITPAKTQRVKKWEYYYLTIKMEDGSIKTHRLNKRIWDHFKSDDKVMIDINGFGSIKEVRFNSQQCEK
jgi:hypothetical protein